MKKMVHFTKYSEETIKKLHECGCILVSGSINKANAMTIGWGLIGYLWGKPFFMVAVRPSRYTHNFIEETEDFTVNVPKRGMENIVNYIGTVSGRDHDKIKEKDLTLVPSKFISSPMILECKINYECRVVFKTKVISESLPKDLIKDWYPDGNFHTIYFAEILNVVAEEK